MKLRSRFSRALRRFALPSCAVAFVLATTSCQFSSKPPVGLSTFKSEASDAFLLSELQQIAPELCREKLMSPHTSLTISHLPTDRIYRRDFFTTFIREKDSDDASDRNVPFIRIEGKGINEGKEVEVSVYRGKGGFYGVERDLPPGTFIDVGGRRETKVSNSEWQVVSEKLYRRQVKPLQ